MTWADGLIRSYRKSKSKITRVRSRLLKVDPKALTDREADDLIKLNEIVNSMVFAIEWMKTGHQPGTYRGISKRGIYQEPYILDKDIFPSLYEPPVKSFYLTPEQRDKALEIIYCLSTREFTCLLMHSVDGMSYAEIGETMNISKNTVRVYVDRARNKILLAHTG